MHEHETPIVTDVVVKVKRIRVLRRPMQVGELAKEDVGMDKKKGTTVRKHLSNFEKTYDEEPNFTS